MPPKRSPDHVISERRENATSLPTRLLSGDSRVEVRVLFGA
jgi:hypothetical protein